MKIFVSINIIAIFLAPQAIAELPPAQTPGDLPAAEAPGDLPAAEQSVLPPLRRSRSRLPWRSRTRYTRRFDRSLESMERNRTITPLERRQLEAGVLPGLDQACRSGALSKEECESGARLRGRVIRTGSNHSAPDTAQKQALQEKLELERQAAADAARRLEVAKRLRFRSFGGDCIYDWQSWGLSSTGVRSVKVTDCGITSEIATDCKNLRISELVGGKWREWKIPSGDRERMFIESCSNVLGAPQPIYILPDKDSATSNEGSMESETSKRVCTGPTVLCGF